MYVKVRQRFTGLAANGRGNARTVRLSLVADRDLIVIPDPSGEPSRMWLFDPLAQELIERKSAAFWNAKARQGDPAILLPGLTKEDLPGTVLKYLASPPNRRPDTAEIWDAWDRERGPWSAYLSLRIDQALKTTERRYAGSSEKGGHSRTRDIRRVAAARNDLRDQLQREPTTEQIAAAVELTPKRVTEMLALAYAARPDDLASLLDNGGTEEVSASPLGGTPSAAFADPLIFITGGDGATYADISPYLAELDPRDQEILTLVLIEGKTRTEAAEIIGMSQTGLSKRLAKLLTTLKARYLEDNPE